MGITRTFDYYKYEGENGDIKVVRMDVALQQAVAGWNNQPAGSKSDKDTARVTGSRKRIGQRVRQGRYRAIVNGVAIYKNVPIFTKTKGDLVETAAKDPSVTTYNFTFAGRQYKLIGYSREVNN